MALLVVLTVTSRPRLRKRCHTFIYVMCSLSLPLSLPLSPFISSSSLSHHLLPFSLCVYGTLMEVITLTCGVGCLWKAKDNVMFNHFSSYFETGYINEPEAHHFGQSHWSACQGYQGSCCHCIPAVAITGMCYHLQISRGCWGYKLGSSCLPCISPTEPPPPSVKFLFLN